jgi:photosystem II stability/assembly factor-like uncharacterized protein
VARFRVSALSAAVLSAGIILAAGNGTHQPDVSRMNTSDGASVLPVASITPRAPHPTGFFPGWFTVRSTGWFVTTVDGKAALSYTKDGGAHWVPQVLLQYPHLFQRDMSFIDGSTGYVAMGVPQNGRLISKLMRTTDSGTHWGAVGLPRSGLVDGLDFASVQHGWVLMEGALGTGVLYVTDDAARSWRPCTDAGSAFAMAGVRATDHLEGVRFVDDKHGWLAGWSAPAPLAPQPLYYYTSDGCQTWTAIHLPTVVGSSTGSAVSFVDLPVLRARTGGAEVVFESRTSPHRVSSLLLATADAGRTWSVPEPTMAADSGRAWSVDGKGSPKLVSPTNLAVNGDDLLGAQTLDNGDELAAAIDRQTGRMVLLESQDDGHTWAIAYRER